MSTSRLNIDPVDWDKVPEWDGKVAVLIPDKSVNFSRLDDFINNLGTIGYGINGASGYFGLATTLTASLGHTLPFDGIVMGMIDLLNYSQQYKRDGYGPNPPADFLFTVRALSSFFLIGAGIKEATHWHAFALGVPGCGLLFAAYTVKAAVDFLGALHTFAQCQNAVTNISQSEYDPEVCDLERLQEKRNKALVNLITKNISLIGWSLLAAGHPLGWVFLAATGVTCVVHALYKYGFFSSKKEDLYYCAYDAKLGSNYAGLDSSYAALV